MSGLSPVDPEVTTVSLWTRCEEWKRIAARIAQLADEDFIVGSREHSDNEAVEVVDSPPAVSRYLRERAWNIARMLRALHRLVFDTEVGQFYLDATVMYPLMRAALEDASTIVWLQQPTERGERLTRALQALHQESEHFATNQNRLALVATGVGGEAAVQDTMLEEHVAREKLSVREHFRAVAELLSLDPGAVMAPLSTRRPITSSYGAQSQEFMTWGMLSDLSHFSYMTLAHLATSKVPGSSVQLLHVVMAQFVRTVNRACVDAIGALERAARPPDAGA
ncbi:hypothetical protein M3147_14475 [Agromyces mediolanus]|uniref:hypothetical protein n=1 Tax=Agromyces mediolanus TaxID=41986 RepID=UPI00203D5B8B|nr:hypothetical protein [Agromyces mediolanus]MCM3658459.1 hypothetical protein [Agromyces mediolanus]